MSVTMEERLKAYGAVLDRAMADDLLNRAAVVSGGPTQPRRRTRQLIVAVVAIALTGVVAVAVTQSRGHTSGTSQLRQSPTSLTTTQPSTSHVEANLGPCPNEFHFGSGKLNAGVAGIDKKFVPIAALSVRLCRYDFVRVNAHTSAMRLTGSGVLSGAAATQLEDLANHLPTTPTHGCSVSRLFLLTFADETHHVDLEEGTNVHDPIGCGPVNGALGGGQSTLQWLHELKVNTAARQPQDGPP
jgi:hypothetical protein